MAILGKIELAHEPDFAIGALIVSPSRRELARPGGVREILEHRVMQVLVALMKADGAIVTRDELTRSCWEGRIVGEDAINRVISRLRKASSGIGQESFRIETITKIGYRLTTPGMAEATTAHLAEAAPPMPARWLTRRKTLGGLIAAGAVAGAGGLLLTRPRAPAVPPEVQRLMAAGRLTIYQSGSDNQNQAIGIFRRVVELAPDYADGWGWLGIAYAIPSHYRDRTQSLELRERADSAARRALALDPGNGFGELAIAIALPFIGHWQAKFPHLLRALADRPHDEQVVNSYSVNLQFTGRASEAVPYYEKIEERPIHPGTYRNYFLALWSSGRLEELDRVMTEALSLYPTNGTLWFNRLNILLYSGRVNAAVAMTQDVESRPASASADRMAEFIDFAETFQNRDPARVERVMADRLAQARRQAGDAEFSIRDAAALGRIDDAFALAEAYFFGRGFTIPDFAGRGSSFSPDQRQSRLLFEPVTKPMRDDPRFEPLVAELGLDRYWRESGNPPDYRQVAA